MQLFTSFFSPDYNLKHILHILQKKNFKRTPYSFNILKTLVNYKISYHEEGRVFSDFINGFIFKVLKSIDCKKFRIIRSY